MPVYIPTVHYPRSTRPSYHVFKCGVCHGEISVPDKKDLIKCVVCKKNLCPKCDSSLHCPDHFARLPAEVQEQLSRIGDKYRLAETTRKKKENISIIVMFTCLILEVIVIPCTIFFPSLSPGIFFIGGLLLFFVILAGSSSLAKSREKAGLAKQSKSDQKAIIKAFAHKRGASNSPDSTAEIQYPGPDENGHGDP